MRKIKSLVLFGLSALAIGCSSGNKDVEQASASELYTKGATALQEGGYTEAIRYLKATKDRFPGSIYQEQSMIDLIYANYKSQNYNEIEYLANDFTKLYPNSKNLDYVLYITGLAYSAMGDNMIQDFFGIDRATRETTSIRSAFKYFEALAVNFPSSPYTQDALVRMAYIKDALARHELEIAKFYEKRNAWVAVSNRVVGMLQLYPDSQATYDGLFLMKKAYEKMGLTQLADQTQQVIDANKGRKFSEVEKPKEPELKAPKA